MAEKAAQRMTKEELRAPDEVQVALGTFWEKLYKYRKAIIGAVVALVAIGIVLWFLGRSKEGDRAQTGDALAEALRPVGASTGEEPPWPEDFARVPKPPHFADEATRLAAAETSVEQFLSANQGKPVAEAVALTRANLKLRKGDHAAALADVDAWLAAHPQSPAVALAHELRSRALLAAGRHEDAIAALNTAAGLVSGPLKATLLTRVGDLQNPAMFAGKGSAEAALANYKQALALLPPATPPQPGYPVTGPRPMLEARISLLE
jgi:tetratricopeptide (TPR) repeat protein